MISGGVGRWDGSGHSDPGTTSQGVTCLPFGATHSGRSGGPASLRYRHSFRPLAGPPGIAHGRSHTLRVDRGRWELRIASILPLPGCLHDCHPLPGCPPSLPPPRPHLRCSWARSDPARTSHRLFRESPPGSGTPHRPGACPGTARGPNTPRPTPPGMVHTVCRRNRGSSRVPAGRGCKERPSTGWSRCQGKAKCQEG